MSNVKKESVLHRVLPEDLVYLSAVLWSCVVGQLDLLKGNHLSLHQLFPQEWSIRMRVEPVRRWRIRFASHQPRGAMVSVTVALVVTWHNVQDHGIVGSRVNAGKAAPHSWEHSPVMEKGSIFLLLHHDEVGCQSRCPIHISGKERPVSLPENLT